MEKMRKEIKQKLTDLEEKKWPTQWLPKENIEEIVDKIHSDKINIWYYPYDVQDAHAYCEFKVSPSKLEYGRCSPRFIIDLQKELNFWKKHGKEEYLLLTIKVSLYKKFITSYWDVIPTININATEDIITKEDVIKNRELVKKDFEKIYTRQARVSKTPPNEECKILQEKIIKILEQEGFVYVTPEECDEEFNGKKLYDILFAYI